VGKKIAGRLRVMMLHWMMDTRSGITYQNVKKNAQRRDKWRNWNLGPV